MSRPVAPLVVAGLLLLLAPAATAQLDPAASKLAAKELKIVAKSAAFEHRVQLFDAYINLAITASMAFVDVDLSGFDADSVDQLGQALNGLQVELQAATRNAAELLAAQIPYALQQGFAGTELYGQLPKGFRPGDDGVLDDFRAKLAKQQHIVFKAVAKGLQKGASYVAKKSGVRLDAELVEPEVPWMAGDQQAAGVGACRYVTLDVILSASDSSSDIGRRILLAGAAPDAAGTIDITLLGPDGLVQQATAATTLDGRWTATLTDVAVNPAVVRIAFGGTTLIERAVGMP